VQYRIALPEFVRDAIPAQIVLIAELATKADDERLDWPTVRRRLDCPQTDARKHPGKVGVWMAGEELWQLDLPDDPADCRGVLSHFERTQHGSYGYLVRKKLDLTPKVSLRDKLRAPEPLRLEFRTLDKPKGRGLSIYGRRLGRYPIDPTLIIQTARDLSHPVGWTSREPVAVRLSPDKPEER
jgi:hypothetical protein